MKLSCKVVEDLLPMYYDGVCSEESRALVEEHLGECPDCRAMLDSLKGELEVPKPAWEDTQPLKELKTAWDTGKRKAAKKGACIVLAVLLAVLTVWTGIWYFGYARYYDQLAGAMDRVTDQVAAMTTASHTATLGDYAYVLKKPGFLGEGGFVHVAKKDGMVIYLNEEGETVGSNREIYIDMFFYPRFGGGYEFAILFDYVMGDHVESGGWAWVKPDLSLDMEGHNYTETEIAECEQLLEENREEIEGLFDAVYELWGIQYLEK